jgi:hypothetical protein
MDNMKLISITALAAIMSVAVIVASIEQPTMAVTQRNNGAAANSAHGTNANGFNGGNGGVGGDAAKAGVGGNGGTNTLGNGGCTGCGPG